MTNYKPISDKDGEILVKTARDGEILVKTARKVVSEFLKSNNKMKLDSEFEKSFSFNSGVFVTLKKVFPLIQVFLLP